MKISVVTTVDANGLSQVDRCIESVMAQDYSDKEHLIVPVNGVHLPPDLLEKYGHLVPVPPPDKHGKNQAGVLSIATGDIIVNLEPGCVFCEGVFSAVISTWDKETQMVVGNVMIPADGDQDDPWRINNPKIDFKSMLFYWEPDAYSLNPLGYFYHRSVAEKVGYGPGEGGGRGLEFLLDAARFFPEQIKKADLVFGEATLQRESGAAYYENQLDFWKPENFLFLERFIDDKTPGDQEVYRTRQACGCQVLRHQVIDSAVKNNEAGKLLEKGTLVCLPSSEFDTDPHTGFVEYGHLIAPGDTITGTLCGGKAGSISIVSSILQMGSGTASFPSFHLHMFYDTTAEIQRYLEEGQRYRFRHAISVHSLRHFWDKQGTNFTWKFIAGIRDPVARMISSFYEITSGERIDSVEDFLAIRNYWKWYSKHFDRMYRDELGINVFDYPFDREKGYSIIRKDNLEILLYTLESLNENVEEAMLRFLGISGFKMIRANEAKNKSYKQTYKKTLSILEGALPRKEIEGFYSDKVTTHFYREEKIEELMGRWTVPSTSTVPLINTSKFKPFS